PWPDCPSGRASRSRPGRTPSEAAGRRRRTPRRASRSASVLRLARRTRRQPADLPEAVAHRAHRLDEVGVLLTQLGPEAPDVHVDGAGSPVVLIPPDPAEQGLAGEDLAGVGGEEA